MKRAALLLATGCYAGMIPGAPGTYASLLCTLAFFLVFSLRHRIEPALHLSAVCLIAALGALAAAEVSRQRAEEDPHIVVIDEIAGQLTAFLFLPVTPFNLAAGFLLFRLFDIWKPFPIRRLEGLKNGVGIMADDLVAGIYADAVLQAIHAWLPYPW